MRTTTVTQWPGKKEREIYTVRAHLLVYFPFGQITTFSSNERKVECITVRCTNVPSIEIRNHTLIDTDRDGQGYCSYACLCLCIYKYTTASGILFTFSLFQFVLNIDIAPFHFKQITFTEEPTDSMAPPPPPLQMKLRKHSAQQQNK